MGLSCASKVFGSLVLSCVAVQFAFSGEPTQQPDGGWKELRRFDNLSLATREAGVWKLRVVRAFPTK